MHHFQYRKGRLHAEDVPLERIAREVGTPTYVYSTATLTRHYRVMTEAFAGADHSLCYAVKASSNVALLRLLHQLGSGFDIVSVGELARVLHATKGDASRVVFAGVGKTEDEMAAALKAGILLFNVESGEELDALDRVGRRLKMRAPFAIRVNPEVDARTHRHIDTGHKASKFGVAISEARELYRRSRKMKGVVARGVDCHIGSQLTHRGPMKQMLSKVVALYCALVADGFGLEYLDVGGGLGIPYRDEERPPTPADYAAIVREGTRASGAKVLLEPGRVLVGNAAILLTRVLYRKRAPAKQFVVVDAGMNDLIRPALYEAHHEILPARQPRGRTVKVDVVGPICESTDVLARERRVVLPEPGDLWAIMSAGAYGMSMASTYNSRPLPAEVLVDGAGYRVIRAREAVEDLWRAETA